MRVRRYEAAFDRYGYAELPEGWEPVAGELVTGGAVFILVESQRPVIRGKIEAGHVPGRYDGSAAGA